MKQVIKHLLANRMVGRKRSRDLPVGELESLHLQPEIPGFNDSIYFAGWQKLPNQQDYDNAFKAQWELFLRHVVKDEPFRWDLLEGAKGVQLAEKGIESWQKRAWVDVPALER